MKTVSSIEYIVLSKEKKEKEKYREEIQNKLVIIEKVVGADLVSAHNE